MYRPENWENPYGEQYDNQPHRAVVYEAGADAMLKALREEGWIVITAKEWEGRYVTIPIQLLAPAKGRLTFIPDEEE